MAPPWHEAKRRPPAAGPPPQAGRAPRVALYSHDAQGLGHVRRNLAIAAAIADGGESSALLITGAREASVLAMPPGVDCLSLPALKKGLDGTYAPRSLGVSLDDLLRLRSRMICAALDSYRPDVLIVDKHPLGIRAELEPSLELLKSREQTKLVLGLRDVLDEPTAVARDWQREGAEGAIAAFYDAIWVYGDPNVYDPVREYGLPPAIASRLRYSGYLCRLLDAPSPRRLRRDSPSHDAEMRSRKDRSALCVLGGGQDGFELAREFAQAERPGDMAGTLVTGPLMAAKAKTKLRRLAAGNDVSVVEFVDRPERLLARADRVVSMGGYNTLCEVVSMRRRALIVPRVKPRAEQAIRAERFQRLGLVDCLEPDKLTSAALGAWLAQPDRPAPDPRSRFDMNGLSTLPRLLADLIESPANARQEPAAVVA